ncbi:MAG: type IX secretion system sortase PorU [Flammeovirgaceae bacterium]|nr:type IX secretion system sortase PorU [Flammeovirgaceae bacterium]
MRNLVVFISLIPFATFGQLNVLSQGDWFKIGVTEEGIYKIDKAFLDQIGIDYSDPNTIKIFGNGVGMLPQANDAERPAGLLENSLKAYGLEDGTFHNTDQLLFYAKGPNNFTWSVDHWVFEKNNYCDTSYYFITSGGAKGARISEQSALPEQSSITNSFMARIAHEQDEENLLGNSGKMWLERYFRSGESRNYQFHTPNALSTVNASIRIVGRSDLDGAFEVFHNGSFLGSIPYENILTGTGSTYEIKGNIQTGEFQFIPQSTETILGLTLPNVPGYDVLLGYLDQICLTYERELIIEQNILSFSNPSINESFITYEMTDTDPLEVWEVTNNVISQIPLITTGTKVRFTVKNTGTERLVAFSNYQAPNPFKINKIKNQNISILSPRDGIIITHPDFLVEAKRLANFHLTHDQLDIAVVTTTEIYNEFSSGMQDVTAIRDAIRFYWKKNATFRYALLFGDCSYDYKYRISNNTNFVPVYESQNAIDPVQSYSSDDYFGFMEEAEGIWTESYAGDHTMEIGIGRLPVKTMNEANGVVNKIIRYATSERMNGAWKNSLTYVVDDGDGNRHVSDAESLSDYMEDFQPQTTINKLYIDAVKQEILSNKELAPLTQSALKTALENGTFMVNYLGHGNEKQWASENVLNDQFISEMTNRFYLPIFVTATCEFGRYDDPTFGASGAEKLLLNQNGGAIALLTTTRPVYATSNYLVNAAFHSNLFKTEQGAFLRLGDIMRLTKNESLSGPYNRNFSLLGDPMLMLQYPKNKVYLTSINEKLLGPDQKDTLSALERISLKGVVKGLDSSPIENFNGTVSVAVFDRLIEKQTLGQESSKFNYTVRENKLFDGLATISNGLFEIEFILPKNISYRFEQGKITLYAQSEDLSSDASGSNLSVVIGGSAENPLQDEDPPIVNIFMDDYSFKNGGVIGSSSLFIAKISDESGINTSGIGINQDITLTLEDGTQYILNNYYRADLNTYQSGSIVFPLRDLPIGAHFGVLKISDLHNNVNTTFVNFTVKDDPQILLYNVKNYPNPAYDKTTFTFEHDRKGEALDVNLVIYDLHGQIIKEESFKIDDSPQIIDDISVVLNQSVFSNGIYLCKINVKSNSDGAIGTVINKLLIIK